MSETTQAGTTQAETTLSTIDALDARLTQMDTAGPRFDDATTEGAFAFKYTCKALEAHYPFLVLGLQEKLAGIDAELFRKLEALGRVGVPETDFAIPYVSSEFAEEALAYVLKKPVPIVVKGGATGSQADETWTPSFFKTNYGDYELPLAKGKVQDAKGTIAQVVEDIESGTERGHYVHNVANFFNEHRELEDQLPIKQFMEYVAPANLFGCQLFMGGAKTGTSWHHASGWNFFFNVYGEKQWFMAHPTMTPWIYGRMHPSGSAGMTKVDHNKPARAQIAKFPLYRHVPVYSIVLQPGDVLVVPPWWWHAITNISSATIAVSTRWLNFQSPNTTPILRLAQGLMPGFQEFEKEAMEQQQEFRIRDKYIRDTYDNAAFRSDAP
ncbi:MAG: cupin-like domain-containing protein [Chloroflexota bacterium]